MASRSVTASKLVTLVGCACSLIPELADLGQLLAFILAFIDVLEDLAERTQ
jgi:hypothetical protein